jgi:hypothetical protein
MPEMISQFATLHESCKGFKSQVFLVDEATDEGACLSLWETKEDIDGALAVCIPPLQKAADMLQGEPGFKAYTVAHTSQK